MGRDPFNQNSDRSDREKKTTSKGARSIQPKFWLNGSRPWTLRFPAKEDPNTEKALFD